MKKICQNPECGKEYEGGKNHRYCPECGPMMRRKCSREWQKKYYKALRDPNAEEPKTCRWCGITHTRNSPFCSDECEVKHKNYINPNLEVKTVKKNPNSLENTVKKAREMGISYGQLKAMEFAESCRVQV